MTDSALHPTVARALELAPILDGHNDLPWESRISRDWSVEGLETTTTTQTDLARLRSGHVGAQLWSVYVEDRHEGAIAVKETLEQIDWVHRFVAAYPDDLVLARSAADVEAARASGRIASLLGAEGAHQLDDSPAVLRMYAALGVRYLTLTHNFNSAWGDSATDERVHDGLTDRGREYIGELNRLGMLVDLSHVAASTMHAALDVATAPVIFSHSSARALTGHLRNVPDDVLKRLPENGGVVMIAYVPMFVDETVRAWFLGGQEGDAPITPIARVADHVEHVRDVAGIRHVGLGSDYDGFEHMPEGMGGVDGHIALLTELASRGWDAADLAGLAGANVLRVLRATDDAFAGHRPQTTFVR